MVGITRIDQRHDDRHHRIVVWTALAVKADERAPPADRAVHFRIGVDEVGKVTDDDVLRVDADVLEDVELLEGRLPRNASVRENRNVRRKVRAANPNSAKVGISGAVRSDVCCLSRQRL